MMIKSLYKSEVSRLFNIKLILISIGPLDTRVLTEGQLLRTTSNKSVNRVSEKGNRSGGSMGSSLMNGWRGVASSLFGLFGNGGETKHVFFRVLIRCNDLRTPYHILWWRGSGGVGGGITNRSHMPK